MHVSKEAQQPPRTRRILTELLVAIALGHYHALTETNIFRVVST